jgi:hypothetical protein
MVDALLEEINKWEEEETTAGRLKPTADAGGRVKLPLVG